MEIVIRLDVLAERIKHMNEVLKKMLLWVYSHGMELIGIGLYGYICYIIMNWLMVA